MTKEGSAQEEPWTITAASLLAVTKDLVRSGLTFSPCCRVISRSTSQSSLFPTSRSSASSEAYCNGSNFSYLNLALPGLVMQT